MKRTAYVVVLLVTVLGLLLAACGSSAPTTSGQATPGASSVKILRMMGGPVGGTYFVLAAGFTPIIEKYAGIKSSASSGYFSAENISLLRDKESDITFGTADAIFEAYSGTGSFDKNPQKWLRTFHTGHDASGNLVARADSGIKTPADLKGKRFLADSPSSPIMQAWTDSLLEAYGLTRKDVDIQRYVGHPQTIAALKEKRADAALITGALVTSAVTELTASVDTILVPITKDKLAEMQKKRPYIIGMMIPAKTYKGQNEDTLEPGVKAQAIVRDDVPEDVVYKAFKALDEHQDEVAKVHPSAGVYSAKYIFDAAIIPYHSGVVKYLKEKGLWTAEKEQWQKDKLAGK